MDPSIDVVNSKKEANVNTKRNVNKKNDFLNQLPGALNSNFWFSSECSFARRKQRNTGHEGPRLLLS